MRAPWCNKFVMIDPVGLYDDGYTPKAANAVSDRQIESLRLYLPIGNVGLKS